MPKGQYSRQALRTKSTRAIGYAELQAARKQAAERARTRRVKINVVTAIGLVVLYIGVSWLVAHWGGKL